MKQISRFLILTFLFFFFSKDVTFSQHADSKRVILVLDGTYTMRGNNSLDIMKSWANTAIDYFNDGDSLCIITFSNYAKISVPFLPVHHRQFMLNVVNDITPTLATYVYDGLSLALEVHNWRNPDQHRESVIVLLSDGLAPNDDRLDAIASEIDSLNCILHVVQTTFADDMYVNQLKTLAENAGGVYLQGVSFKPERIVPLIRH